MTFIWERSDWPEFRWDAAALMPRVAEARCKQGRLSGLMEGIGFDLRLESEMEATLEDVIKTSAIEGEVLNPASVRPFIARRLGLPDGGLEERDRKVEGVVDMVLDAVRNHARPLTAERLYGWHAGLFPTGYSGIEKIDVGQWRTDRLGAMQVVSGAMSLRPKVHFEAPPAFRVEGEMDRFLGWFNAPHEGDGLVRAAVAHLWFVTIHPMDDGNGRMARAIADLAVARMEKSGQRFYSMSSQIAADKAAYYRILESTQRSGPDITEWLLWFTDCYARAVDDAEVTASKVVAKARFWHEHASAGFSERQVKVLGKLLDGFDGGMTAPKWAAICRCSPDTANRDIADLVGRGLLTRNPGAGKNTSYSFTWKAGGAGARPGDGAGDQSS